jgi:sec-independent protein translocase protein TatA
MQPFIALSPPGPTEWFIILIIVLVLFGAKRLPELARGLGKSLSEFRKAKDEFDREVQRSAQDLTIKEAADKKPHDPPPAA